MTYFNDGFNTPREEICVISMAKRNSKSTCDAETVALKKTKNPVAIEKLMEKTFFLDAQQSVDHFDDRNICIHEMQGIVDGKDIPCPGCTDKSACQRCSCCLGGRCLRESVVPCFSSCRLQSDDHCNQSLCLSRSIARNDKQKYGASNGSLILRKRQLKDIDSVLRHLNECPLMHRVRIVEMDVSRNLLKKVPSSFGNVSKSLKVLNLANNSIDTLPHGILQLHCLEVLIIENNQIRQLLPIGFAKSMPNLRILRASGNYIDALPDDIGSLRRLEVLQMGSVTGGNSLTHLPQAIGNMNSLRELDVSNNFLELLPREIGSMSNLETLTLCNNRLEKLPATIGFLSKLERLNISRNRLYILPSSLSRLGCLRLLDATRNALCAMTIEITEMRGRTTILLAGNPFLKSNVYGEELDQRLKAEGVIPFREILPSISMGDSEEHDNSFMCPVPSLVELCARTIKKNDSFTCNHAKYLPEHLSSYLEQDVPISCAGCCTPCVKEYLPCVQLLDILGNRSVPTLVKYCSSSCRHSCSRLQNNISPTRRGSTRRRYGRRSLVVSAPPYRPQILDIEDGLGICYRESEAGEQEVLMSPRR